MYAVLSEVIPTNVNELRYIKEEFISWNLFGLPNQDHPVSCRGSDEFNGW